MCSRPSTSFPDLMRWSVVASVFSSTAMLVASFVRWAERFGVPAILTYAFEVAAATRAAVLTQQQLRSKERYQFGRLRAAKRARNQHRHPPPAALQHNGGASRGASRELKDRGEALRKPGTGRTVTSTHDLGNFDITHGRQGTFDIDARHLLAPGVVQVGVVQRTGAFVGRGGDRRDCFERG